MAQMVVQLQRHPGSSWGFRLGGGRDYAEDLTVKKVEPGSPADGQLCTGDLILAIGATPTNQLTHMQANGIIKSAPQMIQLTIVRGPSTDFSAIKPTGPIKFSPWKYEQTKNT
jgi:C-terminal processing protease CtpA/Prc